MLASWNGAHDCVELLLTKGHADSVLTRKWKDREEDYTAICFAALAGHARCIRVLLQHGGTVRVQDHIP